MSFARTAGRLSLGILILQSVIACGCRRNPADIEAKYLERGKARMAFKDYSRAMLEFRNAVAAMPSGQESHYQLGLAYLGAGDADDVAEEFRKAVELRPGHIDAQVRLAELMARSPDVSSLSETEKRARDLLRTDPDNVEAMNVAAFAELKLGNPDDAEQQLRVALESFPQNLSASVVRPPCTWRAAIFEGRRKSSRPP